MTPEEKLIKPALIFIARQGLLEKFEAFLKCQDANAKAEQDVRKWITKQARNAKDPRE